MKLRRQRKRNNTMIKLIAYDNSFETITLKYISEFFGFHHSLVFNIETENNDNSDNCSTLLEWLTHPNALFVILSDDVCVGFVRINFRGPNVAWIEDIFVDSERRCQGIASAAISEVESIVRNIPGYTAVCLDVSPRNENALRLYHKLGFIDLSLITLRKEFRDGHRDKSVNLLGLNLRY